MGDDIGGRYLRQVDDDGGAGVGIAEGQRRSVGTDSRRERNEPGELYQPAAGQDFIDGGEQRQFAQLDGGVVGAGAVGVGVEVNA